MYSSSLIFKSVYLGLLLTFCIGCQGSGKTAILALEAGDRARAAPEDITLASMFIASLDSTPYTENVIEAINNNEDYGPFMWLVRDDLATLAREEFTEAGLLGDVLSSTVEVAAPFLPPPFNILAIAGSIYAVNRLTQRRL